MRNDLGKPSPGTRPSWSAVINVQEDEAFKLIDRFCLTKVSVPLARADYVIVLS